jgi:hypothetical protein
MEKYENVQMIRLSLDHTQMLLYYVSHIKLICLVKQFIFVDLGSTRGMYCVTGLAKQFNAFGKSAVYNLKSSCEGFLGRCSN